MPTAEQYRSFIRGQKDKNCPPYSKLDKEGLRKLAIKMGWMDYTDIQRGAISIRPKKREKKEIKETKEVKMGSIPEMKREAERLKKLYETLRTRAKQASALGRG